MKRAALAVAALLASPVAASDPLALRALGGVVYDSNVFRLPGGVQPLSGGGRDDFILQAQAGARVEANLSMQQFVIDAAATRYDFRNHGDLSFTGIAATGTWNWRVGSRFSGSAGYDLQRRQTSFAEFRQVGRNIVTVRQPFFEGRYLPGSTLFAYANYRHTSQSNSSAVLQSNDYRSDAYGAGLGYALRNGGSLRFGAKRTDTNFPTDQFALVGGVPVLIRNDYRLEEAEATIAYPFSVKTALNGRVAYTKRTVDQISSRDFSGVTGRMAFDYTPSPLWTIELSARRELSSYDDIQTNFVTSKALAAFAEYHPRDYWSLRLEGETARRKYEGVAIVAPTAGRSDRNRYVSLSSGYLWRLGNRIDVSVRRETRNSTFDPLDYRDTTASATLTLVFGGPQVVR